MKKRHIAVRAVCFLILLVLVLIGIQSVFRSTDSRAYSVVRGFSLEPSNTLDAVYVGSSNVHAFWQPPVAWEEYGIAVYSYSINKLPMRAIKYLIMEARKTQPEALYIVNLNSIVNVTKDTPISVDSIHRAADFLPLSLNKYQMILQLCKDANFTGASTLEYFFPIIRFHERWSSLKASDFSHKIDIRKRGLMTSEFIKSSDVSLIYSITQEKTELTDLQLEVMDDLLDYFDSEQVKVLFVIVPQALSSDYCSQLNAVEELVRGRGYECLDLLENYEPLEIILETDFYNKKHTNVHGSLKFTDWLGSYLVEHYGFEDKQDDPDWESWDLAAEQYERSISQYTLPFERTHMARSYDLAAPELGEAETDGTSVQIVWEAVEGADGYMIYRKSKNEAGGSWNLIAEADASVLSYTDVALNEKTKYNYTVVPIKKLDGDTLFGNFSFSGISAVTGRG